jgi:hypothetical protein
VTVKHKARPGRRKRDRIVITSRLRRRVRGLHSLTGLDSDTGVRCKGPGPSWPASGSLARARPVRAFQFKSQARRCSGPGLSAREARRSACSLAKTPYTYAPQTSRGHWWSGLGLGHTRSESLGCGDGIWAIGAGDDGLFMLHQACESAASRVG